MGEKKRFSMMVDQYSRIVYDLFAQLLGNIEAKNGIFSGPEEAPKSSQFFEDRFSYQKVTGRVIIHLTKGCRKIAVSMISSSQKR